MQLDIDYATGPFTKPANEILRYENIEKSKNILCSHPPQIFSSLSSSNHTCNIITGITECNKYDDPQLNQNPENDTESNSIDHIDSNNDCLYLVNNNVLTPSISQEKEIEELSKNRSSNSNKNSNTLSQHYSISEIQNPSFSKVKSNFEIDDKISNQNNQNKPYTDFINENSNNQNLENNYDNTINNISNEDELDNSIEKNSNSENIHKNDPSMQISIHENLNHALTSSSQKNVSISNPHEAEDDVEEKKFIDNSAENPNHASLSISDNNSVDDDKLFVAEFKNNIDISELEKTYDKLDILIKEIGGLHKKSKFKPVVIKMQKTYNRYIELLKKGNFDLNNPSSELSVIAEKLIELCYQVIDLGNAKHKNNQAKKLAIVGLSFIIVKNVHLHKNGIGKTSVEIKKVIERVLLEPDTQILLKEKLCHIMKMVGLITKDGKPLVKIPMDINIDIMNKFIDDMVICINNTPPIRDFLNYFSNRYNEKLKISKNIKKIIFDTIVLSYVMEKITETTINSMKKGTKILEIFQKESKNILLEKPFHINPIASMSSNFARDKLRLVSQAVTFIQDLSKKKQISKSDNLKMLSILGENIKWTDDPDWYLNKANVHNDENNYLNNTPLVNYLTENLNSNFNGCYIPNNINNNDDDEKNDHSFQKLKIGSRLTENWLNRYWTWNLGFTARLPHAIPRCMKLLIPSVLGAKPDLRMEARVIALFFMLIFAFNDEKAKNPLFPPNITLGIPGFAPQLILFNRADLALMNENF